MRSCGNGEVISKFAFCDGYSDCSDNSDEVDHCLNWYENATLEKFRLNRNFEWTEFDIKRFNYVCIYLTKIVYPLCKKIYASYHNPPVVSLNSLGVSYKITFQKVF
jgi:hypothetical protein